MSGVFEATVGCFESIVKFPFGLPQKTETCEHHAVVVVTCRYVLTCVRRGLFEERCGFLKLTGFCFEQSEAVNATCTWEIRAAQWQQSAQQWLANQ